eukprot:251064-Chlamydomonas_euryale.AAC.5
MGGAIILAPLLNPATMGAHDAAHARPARRMPAPPQPPANAAHLNGGLLCAQERRCECDLHFRRAVRWHNARRGGHLEAGVCT